MKLNLGRQVEDYGLDEVGAIEPKKPKKMKMSYPTAYIHDVDLKDVDSKIVGKTVTVPVTLRIKEINQRTRIKDGKEIKENDSMDIELMNIDFGKAPKSFETLQDAIEDGLDEE